MSIQKRCSCLFNEVGKVESGYWDVEIEVGERTSEEKSQFHCK